MRLIGVLKYSLYGYPRLTETHLRLTLDSILSSHLGQYHSKKTATRLILQKGRRSSPLTQTSGKTSVLQSSSQRGRWHLIQKAGTPRPQIWGSKGDQTLSIQVPRSGYTRSAPANEPSEVSSPSPRPQESNEKSSLLSSQRRWRAALVTSIELPSPDAREKDPWATSSTGLSLPLSASNHGLDRSSWTRCTYGMQASLSPSSSISVNALWFWHAGQDTFALSPSPICGGWRAALRWLNLLTVEGLAQISF